MLANDLTGQLARERVADLHRQAETAAPRGPCPDATPWRQPRPVAWMAPAGGIGQSLGCGRQGALDRPINSSTMTGRDATVAVSGTVAP